MRIKRLSLLGTICGLLWVCALSARALELPIVNVDEFPQQPIQLPNGEKTIVVKYNNHNWRKVEPTVLADGDTNDPDICFEAKIEAVVPPDKVKLFGRKGVVIIEESNRFKTATLYKLGDNAWFCGTLKAAKSGKGVEFYVVEMLKLANDVQRFEEQIANLKKRGDSEGLLALGRKIEQDRNDPNLGFRFEEFDKLGAEKEKAFQSAIEIKEAAVKPDDADGLFAVACMWRDLSDKKSKFHELVLKSLLADPEHNEAGRIAQNEMHLIKFEGKWLAQEDIDKINADRALEARNRKVADQHALEQNRRLRDRAAAQRPIELIKYQSALRTGDSAKREGALKSLAEEIQKSPDPGFGEDAIGILINVSSKTGITPALELAGKSPHAEVRKQVLEALAWRGAHNDVAALDVMAAALIAEKDEATAKSCVGALVAMGGRAAAGTLAAGLRSNDRAIRADIIDGLKTVTSKQFDNKDDWDKWWGENKDTFK